MTRKTYTIGLRITVPLIFAGLVVTAFLVAHGLSGGRESAATLLGWGAALAVAAFGLGALIARIMLRPMERFARETEQLPLLQNSPEEPTPAGRPLDEMARYDDLFRRLTHIMSKMEARELFPNIVGQSRIMRGLMSQVLKVAGTAATVCIMGESGTGKELIAQNLHDHSPRRDKPLVKINCAAIPETLLESELFGHEKGAFTGAVGRKPGKFELAHGGSILLDEIGDLPLALQGKILRALEEKEFERVGGTIPIKADVRFLAATNRDLEAMVRAGTFREDLYYRITATAVRLPPLRDRREDIPLLARDFLSRQDRPLALTPEAMDLLTAHPWPGNVRELHNVLGQAALACEGEAITARHIPLAAAQPVALSAADGFLPEGRDLDRHLAEEEKRLVLLALRRSGGVQARAAHLLGIKPRSLWHRIKKHGIDPAGFKAPKNGD